MPNACLCLSFLGQCRMVIVYTVHHQICLFGHNDHLKDLRGLTSTELYENAKFHCQHPVLLACLKVHSSFIQISTVYFLPVYPKKVLIHSFLQILLNL